MLLYLSLLLSTASPGTLFHLPHDDVHDVACAPLPGGGMEMVITSNKFSKVVRSLDRGLSWHPVSGDGLDSVRATRVEYWADPVEPRFFIGSTRGVWIYVQATGEVRKASDGLGGNDLSIAEISAPANGAGPVVLATQSGKVYGWDDAAGLWNELLDTGLADSAAQVAIVPDYDPLAGPGPERTVLAGIAGQLHTSDDGGASWTIHPQFSVPAASSTDWRILSLAFDRDFVGSGLVVLGRGRDNAAFPSGNEGEIWRSSDSGSSFVLAKTVGSSVTNLQATPAGPLGTRHLFAGVEAYPNRAFPANSIGVMRSDDLGLTWDDFGNWQDFFDEVPDDAGAENVDGFMGFAVSPDYASDSTLFYARSENLFRSGDAGLHWRRLRTRPEDQVRGMDVVLDSNGDLLAFAGTYSSFTLKANLTTGQLEVLDRTKLHLQEPISVSPNYAEDGALLAVGEQGVALWFDPTKPANNPFGAQGWLFSLKNNFGFVQNSAISPHFHAGAGVPGSDQTLLWSRRIEGANNSPKTFRTLDGGLTAEEISTLVGGGAAPFFAYLVIAPTYDAASAAGRTDIYAAPRGNVMAKLQDTEWLPLQLFPSRIQGIALDPDFSRPDNPRLFVGLDDPPYLAELVDQPGAPALTLIPSTGLGSQMTSLVAHPDFANQPVLYASTWGAGVWRIDLSQPTLEWEPVGTGYPLRWTNVLRLSPDFLNDQILVAGGQRGFVVGQDSPSAVWTLLDGRSTLDNIDSALSYYQPNDPANPQPDRPWPWDSVTMTQAKSVAGVTLRGPDAQIAATDGAYVEWDGYGRVFTLRTFTGPRMGSVTLTAFDYSTGLVLGSATRDLLTSPPILEADLVLSLPSRSAVRLRAEAQLDSRELFVFDAIGLEQ